MGPKFGALSLHQVTSLHSVQIVLVSNFDKLEIAGPPGSFVGDEGQVWVPFFTVFTHYLTIIVSILDEEVLWVLVDINVDHSKGIMKSWFLDPFIVSSFKPALKESEFTLLFELFYKFRDRTDPNGIKKLFDVNFITI